MRRALAVAALGALAGCGSMMRGGGDWRGAATLRYDATYVHRRDEAPAAPAAPAGLGLVGLRAAGFVSRSLPVGYLAGLSLHGGATGPAGFAYDANLYFLGLGARLGGAGIAGVATGIGASGATGTVDDGVALPVEAFLELGLGRRLRVLARGRAVWLGAAGARLDGAPSFTFTDEVDATLAVRVGRRYRDHGFPSGNGYFLGAAYREAHGARFVGAVLGYAVDVGSR